MLEPDSDDNVTRAMRAFRQHYERAVPFREDRRLAPDLVTEVVPALRVLLAPGAWPNPHSPCTESCAFVHLLGRRAALLGATPTTGLVVAEALVHALSEQGVPVAEEGARALLSVLVEGYSAGRDEAVAASFHDRLLQSQTWLELAPGCVGVFLGPLHDVLALQQLFGDVARYLLRAGTQACVLDLARVAEPPEEVLREVAGFCLTAASLGVVTYACGVSEPGLSTLERFGGPEGVTSCDSFGQAFAQALDRAGLSLRKRGLLWGGLPRRS